MSSLISKPVASIGSVHSHHSQSTGLLEGQEMAIGMKACVSSRKMGRLVEVAKVFPKYQSRELLNHGQENALMLVA